MLFLIFARGLIGSLCFPSHMMIFLNAPYFVMVSIAIYSSPEHVDICLFLELNQKDLGRRYFSYFILVHRVLW